MSLLFAAASCLAERIKINAITRETREGRLLFVKRRRRSARLTLACANHFFRVAGNPIRALAGLPEWQRWEVECFRRLHGDPFHISTRGRRSVAAEALPGIPLSLALERRSLTAAMTAAAGRELRRSHETHCETFPDHWSHGDPHTGNFLYDPATDRARLIDFEVMHDPALPAVARRADDLLVFLQDLAGRVSRSEWLPLACAFLDAYGHRETIAHLSPRLVIPRGIARLWWAIRTSYLPGAELAHRLELLREALRPDPVTA